MSLRIRSSSMGATPRPKKHFTTRAESAATTALDVRCACQFFQSDSLLPERINPMGSRPSSSQGYYSRPISPDLTHHVFEPDYVDPDSPRDFSFGVVGATDYYSESLSSIPNIPSLPDVADANKPTMNGQQNSHLSATNGLNQDIQTESSNLRRDPSQPGYQKSIDTLRQKDPSQSVLLRRRSESTQKNLEGIGRQRDPSTSSILRRRFSEKSVNNIQQRDPSKSSMLRRRMDSQGSLQPQSSIEEPLPKERKLIDSTPASPQSPTNAERFMLSKNTLQTKPSIELSDLYRDTMKFTELEREEQPEPKTFDVGILDLMTLGTSFIQKGVIKEKKEKKSKKDNENVDDTFISTEDVENEPQLDTTNTTEDQPAFSSPTSSALVHIGQNIYIEEPGEQSAMPVKNERRSRRDYPDKVNKKTDDHKEESSGMIREFKKTRSTDEDHETGENISTTLLPRDLREQSTCTVNSQKMESEKSTTLQESAPSECIKQIDVSTSSLLRNRYSQNYSMDPTTDGGHTVNSSPSSLIKQRDPSTSSLLRKRYRQSMDEKLVGGYLTSLQNAKEETSNAIELTEKKDVGFENEIDAIDSHEEIAKNHLPSTPEFRGKLDWIERTYNTR